MNSRTRFVSAPKKNKLSDHLIEQVRSGIISGKFKRGQYLGSERDMVTEFGVSKATVREALRVLEILGLIEIRTGVSGGVYVANVDEHAILHSILSMLCNEPSSPYQITMIRYILEPAVAYLAAQVITEDEIENLGQIIDGRKSGEIDRDPREIGFHRFLPRVVQNPMFVTILDFVDVVLRNLKSTLNLQQSFYEYVRQMHMDVLDCLKARDSKGAARAISKDVLVVGKYMAEVAQGKVFDPGVFSYFPYLTPDEVAEILSIDIE